MLIIQLFFRLPMKATRQTEEYFSILKKILGTALKTKTLLVFKNVTGQNDFKQCLKARIESKDATGSLIATVQSKDFTCFQVADVHFSKSTDSLITLSSDKCQNFDKCFNLQELSTEKEKLINKLMQFPNQSWWEKYWKIILGFCLVGVLGAGIGLVFFFLSRRS